MSVQFASPFAAVQPVTMRQDMILPVFDDEDVAAFCATPNCSHTNSQGHGLSIRRTPEPASDFESSTEAWIPMAPTFLLHGADMPEDFLARLEEDPMPMLPGAMDCGVF